jgi:hypothetical protein
MRLLSDKKFGMNMAKNINIITNATVTLFLYKNETNGFIIPPVQALFTDPKVISFFLIIFLASF